jgi:hypothetical protein
MCSGVEDENDHIPYPESLLISFNKVCNSSSVILSWRLGTNVLASSADSAPRDPICSLVSGILVLCLIVLPLSSLA